MFNENMIQKLEKTIPLRHRFYLSRKSDIKMDRETLAEKLKYEFNLCDICPFYFHSCDATNEEITYDEYGNILKCKFFDKYLMLEELKK